MLTHLDVFLKGASYAHPGYIKNTIKSMLLQNILIIKKPCLFLYILQCNYSCDGKSWINIQLQLLQWSFRNDSNMLIWWSQNISYYHQCWKRFNICWL